jgi:short-subunit dehydrogenase
MEGDKRGTALVTGASSGIGAEFVRQLARERYDVVLVARRREELDRVAAEAATAHGVTTEVLDADLATDEGLSRAEQRIRASRIDLLVNNAGFGTNGTFADLPLDREMKEMDVNVRALVRLSHAALGEMYGRRTGAIINTASTAAFQAVPYMATYAATKAFVLHFSEALHEESKQHGVSVTCLCPGPVKTEFQDVVGFERERLRDIGWVGVESVVECALSAMRARRAITVPGALNVGAAFTAKMAPRFIVRRIAGSMFRNASG